MALEPETREIGGYRYTYTPLGAKRGMRLFTQLAQRLGGSIGAAVGGAGDATAMGGRAIGTLCAQLDPDFLEQVIETLAAQTKVELPGNDGPKLVDLKGVLDLHFAQRLMDQFGWLEFCLETQYTDFLGWLKQALSGGDALRLQKMTGGSA